MEIDPKLKYQTRNGIRVTIYTCSAAGPFPVHGCIHFPNDDREAAWTSDGIARNLPDPLDPNPTEPYVVTNFYDLIPLPNISDLDPSTRAIIEFLKHTSIHLYHEDAHAYEILTRHKVIEMGTSVVSDLIKSISTICPNWRNYID